VNKRTLPTGERVLTLEPLGATCATCGSKATEVCVGCARAYCANHLTWKAPLWDDLPMCHGCAAADAAMRAKL